MILHIKLSPGSSCNKVGEIKLYADGIERLQVYVTAAAEDGKANKAMLKLLAKYFNIPVSSVSIKSGLKSRYKVCLMNM